MITSERLSLARELHDGIAQDLVALGYSLDLLLARADLHQETRSSLRSSRLQVDDLMAKVRKEIFQLRSTHKPDITTTLRAYLDDNFSDLEKEIEISEVEIEDEHADELLRVAQEILRNIGKHSRATRIVLKLFTLNNRTYLEVSDNGIGGVMVRENHWGIAGIRERITRLGGEVSIENLADHYPDETGVRFIISL